MLAGCYIFFKYLLTVVDFCLMIASDLTLIVIVLVLFIKQKSNAGSSNKRNNFLKLLNFSVMTYFHFLMWLEDILYL